MAAVGEVAGDYMDASGRIDLLSGRDAQIRRSTVYELFSPRSYQTCWIDLRFFFLVFLCGLLLLLFFRVSKHASVCQLPTSLSRSPACSSHDDRGEEQSLQAGLG